MDMGTITTLFRDETSGELIRDRQGLVQASASHTVRPSGFCGLSVLASEPRPVQLVFTDIILRLFVGLSASSRASIVEDWAVSACVPSAAVSPSMRLGCGRVD